jgi:hypothetical protein
MKAFIMSTSMWAYVEGRIERESLPNKKEELATLSNAQKEEIYITQNAWDKDNGIAIGQIMLRLSPTV